MTELGLDDSSSRTYLGWNRKYTYYGCYDGKPINISRTTAGVRDLDETKIVPRNRIAYTAGKAGTKVTISGVEFSR